MEYPNFKVIHIGSIIEQKVKECNIDMERICNFMKTTEKEILLMYEMNSLDSEILLKWCKLMKYDFFRFYSQHLIIYSPTIVIKNKVSKKTQESKLPQFRKSVYTQELIEFILEQLSLKVMTRKQIIEEYKIPKTTLYKWINKYT